jgi:hypothetical protein
VPGGPNPGEFHLPRRRRPGIHPNRARGQLNVPLRDILTDRRLRRDRAEAAERIYAESTEVAAPLLLRPALSDPGHQVADPSQQPARRVQCSAPVIPEKTTERKLRRRTASKRFGLGSIAVSAQRSFSTPP